MSSRLLVGGGAAVLVMMCGALPGYSGEDRNRRANCDTGQAGCEKPVSLNTAVAMTPDLIVELRRLLYDFGFPIRGFGPEAGPDLSQSIERLQKSWGRKGTESLTAADVAQLRRIPPPAQWGAISYTGTGGHVGVSRRPTRSDAESAANTECTTKAHKRCRELSIAGKQCVILVHSIYNDGFRPVVQNFVAYGQDPVDLRKTAMAECKAKAQLSMNCEVRRVVCADGRD